MYPGSNLVGGGMATGGGALALTGSNSMWLIVAGVTLVVAGAAMHAAHAEAAPRARLTPPARVRQPGLARTARTEQHPHPSRVGALFVVAYFLPPYFGSFAFSAASLAAAAFLSGSRSSCHLTVLSFISLTSSSVTQPLILFFAIPALVHIRRPSRTRSPEPLHRLASPPCLARRRPEASRRPRTCGTP
jgi:hypothetical protein